MGQERPAGQEWRRDYRGRSAHAQNKDDVVGKQMLQHVAGKF